MLETHRPHEVPVFSALGGGVSSSISSVGVVVSPHPGMEKSNFFGISCLVKTMAGEDGP